MKDLSLHVLDIAENSIEAGATWVEIKIAEKFTARRLIIRIKDNGQGMDKKMLAKALDPFYTTKTVRRVGLGLSMFAQAAHESGGDFSVRSRKGRGTEVIASFVYDHLDRKPLGSMTETIISLVGTQGGRVDIIYEHRKNGRRFIFDSKRVKRALDGVPIYAPQVLGYLRQKISSGLAGIGAGQ
jgi:nitrogen fixation/metabolism regulation signal transduction histidine kinase